MVNVISFGIVLTSLAGLVAYRYFVYTVVRRFGGVFGVMAVIVFYTLAVWIARDRSS
jgi:hypothetical protein